MHTAPVTNLCDQTSLNIIACCLNNNKIIYYSRATFQVSGHESRTSQGRTESPSHPLPFIICQLLKLMKAHDKILKIHDVPRRPSCAVPSWSVYQAYHIAQYCCFSEREPSFSILKRDHCVSKAGLAAVFRQKSIFLWVPGPGNSPFYRTQ